MPSQSPEYGLSAEEIAREAWAIETTGRRYSGAAAVNRALLELGGPWKAIAALYTLPPIRWIEDRVYRWIARNRHHLSRFYSTRPALED